MFENLVDAIHDEIRSQQQLTTRHYQGAAGLDYVVSLPNWRWRILEDCGLGEEGMHRLFDLVMCCTRLWGTRRQNLARDVLFRAYLDDRIDLAAALLRVGSQEAANENLRQPWFVRVRAIGN